MPTQFLPGRRRFLNVFLSLDPQVLMEMLGLLGVVVPHAGVKEGATLAVCPRHPLVNLLLLYVYVQALMSKSREGLTEPPQKNLDGALASPRCL